MIRCAICDDDISFGERIGEYIEKLSIVHNFNTSAVVLSEPKELLSTYSLYDIFFLDIEFIDMNGIDIAKRIFNVNKDAIIILITNHDKYVYESIEINVFRFLPKDRFDLLFERYFTAAIKKYLQIQPQFLVLEDRTEVIKLLFDDILYAEKSSKNIMIYTLNGTYHKRTTIKEFFEELHSERFLIIDRGQIVNINNIKLVKSDLIELKNGQRIYISRRKITEVKTKISEYWRSNN